MIHWIDFIYCIDSYVFDSNADIRLFLIRDHPQTTSTQRGKGVRQNVDKGEGGFHHHMQMSTTAIILCFNKHQLTQVHLENGR